MGRIRILPDQVANQIAAGEVVDRPASVVKELLENALDAGATRIRVEVEAGGRKLIRITDNGHGMNRDDALLAFERHATSKLRTADDLLSIATLGFRGEALPSIASVARVLLETCPAPETDPTANAGTGTGLPGPRSAGTRIEIAGGKILRVEDAALPVGTSIAVQDLFFNTPARRKFLRAESTELSHVTALVTHYALVHPEKHFELFSASHSLLSAPPVARTAERIYQIFGAETLGQLLPLAAEAPLERGGLPEPPPWKRDAQQPVREMGSLRLSGFYSKPELQKLNRNSIYIFVNKRLIRDRLLLHAISEAYRNILPPTSFPVVLLFLEMPPEEVDVNVHPAKTEVRFRQQNVIHDFVRDSLRAALVRSRPAAAFLTALESSAAASPSLMPPPASRLPVLAEDQAQDQAEDVPAHLMGATGRNAAPDTEASREDHPEAYTDAGLAGVEPDSSSYSPGSAFRLTPPAPPLRTENLPFLAHESPGRFEPELRNLELRNQQVRPGDGWQAAAAALFSPMAAAALTATLTAEVEAGSERSTLNALAGLRPLGQLRDSFIVAVDDDGLWIIDQHVAHERVLFEKILARRGKESVDRQRLLMPLLVDLEPWQMVLFAEIAEELEKNGFEAEPFGPRTLAVKAAPAGLEGKELEKALAEVLERPGSGANSPDGFASGFHPAGGRERVSERATLGGRIAASVACHAAIKVNTPLESQKMAWLLEELSKTDHPTSCPHGRPIALRYSWKEIQRAFQRI